MIYGILLAAGTSSRMGQPKQLLEWRGRPLIRHMAEQALGSRLGGLVIVLGSAAAEARAALEGLDGPVQIVENAEYMAGQAGSLRVGIKALPGMVEAVVVLLVDQPLVTPGLIDSLIEAYEEDQSAAAVIPRYKGRRGNPVLLAAELFGELLALEGDTGARAVLERHGSRLRWFDSDGPAVVTDMDTPEEFARLLQG